jgi:two-component system CheB/CheR fusion protein
VNYPRRRSTGFEDDMNAGTGEPLHSTGAQGAPDDDDASALIIVGIGASAGGLEALERLFKALPDRTGMAFVVVQHLSPDFKSLMDELLARHTGMPIHRVEDGMRVEADSVYLIPPRKEMIVADGRLLLTDKAPQRDLSLPIDHFFRSLAQDAGARAIAIVLSGTGSDGSRGIRDVHAAGGLVIVQRPESAQFDGMPKSAHDTGVADLLLAPEEMPGHLVAHAAQVREIAPAPSADTALDGAGSIFKLLRDEYGIDFSYYKPNTVGRRIERRQAMAQLPQLDDYAARLRDDPAERNALYRDLLIGVTRFFRDPEAFDHLEREVLPELFSRRANDDELRIWVAGCATGEEAYSLAILLDERMRLLSRRLNVKIFASDAHRASLEIASAGVYDEEQLAEVTPARLERYFVKRADGWHVSSDLRQMIVFTVHNVIRDAPFTRLDMISCRNLLIYFQQPVQKRVLSLFHFGLRTGGVLFLGPSEGPGALSDEFEDVDGRWKIYRKRRDVRLPADLRQPLLASLQGRSVPLPQQSGSPEQTLGFAYESLLERHLPDGVLIDDRRRLVHAFGDASRFLSIPKGRGTSDLLDLVRPELRIPLAGALQRALKDRAPIAHPPIRVELPGDSARVRMTVEPIANRQSHVTHFHVTFAPAGRPDDVAPAAEMAPEHDSGALVSSLEAELALTRENLQATVEELETSNEELQASNEELVASNEELQSTNEELHSVNQELYTVNAEYQKKIQELTDLTADMDGLLRSTDIGTIFLDENLCIRKFTPQIARTFDLLPHDVGRRIDSFSHNVRYAELLSSLESVLATGEPVEREVQDQHGSWFFLRILPYRTRGHVTGVVLSLIDVSLLKRTEARLEQMSAIVQSSEDAIVGIDLAGRVTTWNHGAERLYGYASDEALGATLADLLRPEGDAGREVAVDVPADALARMRAGLPAVHEVETLRRRKDGSLVDVLLSCSAIRDESGTLVGVSIVARDVSARKAAEREQAERMRLTALRAAIALALADHENLNTSLQRCTEVLVDHAGAAFARLWLRDPDDDDVLVLRASAGLYTHLDGPHGRVRMGELKIGRIAATRRPHLTNDVPGDPHTSDPEWARRERMIAFAGYPLVVANRVVGVLAMFGRKPFPLSLLDDLGAISYQIAQSIERKRAEDASRRYAEELERTNRELRDSVKRREEAEAEARAAVDRRDRFLAILSHELRNPLAAVLNAARLLERAGSNERVRQQAQGAIGRQSRQMARLLDDLLDVSRITRNKIEIRKQVIDLGTAVREACELVRPMIQAREHRLTVDLPEQPVYVNGDPARVQQIAINLLTNAAKYTPPAGAIALTVRSDDTSAELRVRDTGPGIPPAMREKVFDLFFQLLDSVGSSDGGMGVGLTLVRSLIALHGGSIAIEDAAGGGTVFVVHLPLAAEPPRPVAVHGRGNVLDGLHVLVVEDNPDIRTTTVGLLRDFGCVVDSAEDGPSGLAALDRALPDIALVDIGMPGLDGYEVARRIRARPDTRRLRLIALTGFGQEDDRHRALEAGFDAHLVKPIDFEQLANLVAQARS